MNGLIPVDSIDPLNIGEMRTRIRDGAGPFVVRGLVASWPAVQQAKQGHEALAHYLKGRDNGRPASVLTASPYIKGRFGYTPDLEALNFTRSEYSFSAFLDALMNMITHPSPQGLYLQSAPAEDHAPGFSAQHRIPLLPAEVTPRLWMGNATRAALHNDHDHNLACVVAGQRHFLLFPPEELANLYIGPLDHTPSGRPISVAELEPPDFERFPRLKTAFLRAQSVELEPGDTLFIPRHWWHQVTADGPFNMLVNFWWGGAASPLENPALCFNQALACFSGLSEPERVYWREMFRHYIIEPQAADFDHLPAETRITDRTYQKESRAQILTELHETMRLYFGKG